MSNKEAVFVITQNDAEALAIAAYLANNHISYIITDQPHGAGYNEIKPAVKQAIDEAINDGKTVYGVELQGHYPGVVNIDHHRYFGDGRYPAEDRSKDEHGNPIPSTIEQVAQIVGTELSLSEQFVSANDEGFVYGMLDYAEKHNVDSETTRVLIKF